MSDLISRSELLNYLDKETNGIPIDAEKYNIDPNVVDGMIAAAEAFTNKVKKQPTAYDIDKVVEELKKESYAIMLDGAVVASKEVVIDAEIAIEIVKRGGSDEKGV